MNIFTSRKIIIALLLGLNETSTISAMEAPAQANQPTAPQIITLISSEGNRYTLNGPKLLQAEYFKTLLRFEQAKSKAPETVTEISIKMPNTILEPITMLINIAHASSELTEEQTISKLIEAIGNITNIDERIISFLIQAHTFEQPLITRAIARSIAEVITEQDVIHFRQLAPNSEHQNLHPAYQVLIANEMQPSKDNAHWLLQWLINLNEEDIITLHQLTAIINHYAQFIAHNLATAQDQKVKLLLTKASVLSSLVNQKFVAIVQKIIFDYQAIVKTQEKEIFDPIKIREQWQELEKNARPASLADKSETQLKNLAKALIVLIQQAEIAQLDTLTMSSIKGRLRLVLFNLQQNSDEPIKVPAEATDTILHWLDINQIIIEQLKKKPN